MVQTNPKDTAVNPISAGIDRTPIHDEGGGGKNALPI